MPPVDGMPAESEAPEPEFDAESAFLENLTGKKKEEDEAPPEEDSEGTASETEEAPEEEELGEGAGTDAEGEKPDGAEGEQADDPDAAEVVLKVGDKETKVKLGDLKRAYSEQAEVAQTREDLAKDRETTKATASRAEMALQKMVERAQARLKPYTDIDWLLLPQQVDAATYQQLKKDALAAHSDLEFLTKELGGEFEKARNDFMAEGQRRTQEVAKATIKELSDPTTGIPNWGKDTYQGLMDYAANSGFDRGAAMRIVDAPSLRVLHKAMLYDKAHSAVQERVKPAAQASAKRVQKPSGRAGEDRTSYSKAMNTLRSRGTVDDAAAAFFASFGDE